MGQICNMIYKALITLFSLSVRVFFSSFKIKGKENIPTKRPLLVVANHPSTFMDPIVMAVAMKRKVHFIAKGSAFKSRFAKWILPKFNMIPIYRKDFEPGEMHKNEETFEKVYEILEQGGAVIIFPEGISITDRILKRLKTGAMRMALNVEARNDFKLGVQILPLGLNFSNPHQFRSKVEIRIGEAIDVKKYQKSFEKDSMKTVHQLRDEVRFSIEKLIFCVDTPTIDQLIARVETIYIRNFLEVTNRQKLELHEELEISELVRERVNYFIVNDPKRVEQLAEMLENHALLLRTLNLDGETVDIVGSEKSKFTFSDFCFYLCGLPLFIFGFINNYIPYQLPGIFNKKINARPDFKGAILLCTGTFIFLMFYTIQTILVYKLSENIYISLAYLLALPISGLMAYSYYLRIKNHIHTMKYNRLVNEGDAKVEALVQLEINIVTEIESAMKIFDKYQIASE